MSSNLRQSVLGNGIDISCRDAPAPEDFCMEHGLVKDQIVFIPFENYKIGDCFCSYCQTQNAEEYEKQGKFYFTQNVKSAAILINREKKKILEIKSLNLQEISRKTSVINPTTQNSLSILDNQIKPISGEIEKFVKNIKDGIFVRLSGSAANIDEIKQIKDFINSMTLKEDGQPVLNNIGNNIKLQIQNVDLAVFLLNWNGIGEMKPDFSGIVNFLKESIEKFYIQRQATVERMDSEFGSLLGPLYDFIFSLENLPVDEEFRRKFRPQYINEPYCQKLISAHNIEIQKKDTYIAELEAKVKAQAQQIADLTAANAQYKTDVATLNQNLIDMKNEFEKKIRILLEKIKVEHEKKILEITTISNEWQSKYHTAQAEAATAKAEFERRIRDVEQKYQEHILSRDRQIIMLTSSIKTMREDWEKLKIAYGLLETELNKQLCCNDELRAIIKNIVEAKDKHTNHILSYENEMKILFETFVRTALKNKTIDFMDPTEKVNNCQKEAEICRGTLSEMKLSQPAKSYVFEDLIEINLKDVKPELTNFEALGITFPNK